MNRYYKTKSHTEFRLFLLPNKTPELQFVQYDWSDIYTIMKRGTHFYYTNYADPNKKNDESYNPVVDFKDRLLIIDNSYSGKLNDFSNPRRFRNVYMLVPKYF